MLVAILKSPIMILDSDIRLVNETQRGIKELRKMGVGKKVIY